MPTVRLSFSPAPAHVRTARLVGVAVARRAGVSEELLEEIRLAIGEACSRAVALHRSIGLADLIDVTMGDDQRFTVEVMDHAARGGKPPASVAGAAGRVDPAGFLAEGPGQALAQGVHVEAVPDALAEEAVVARMGLALLAGLVDDLEVALVPGDAGTAVRMSWPLERAKIDDDDE
jgi:anti-sigma regulatory factor (Ser/Thr protein kinase)